MNTSLSRLLSFYGELKITLLLQAMIKREFPGSIGVLTSFGRDSGLLLSMVAAIDPATPVLFLDTGKHFKETLTYAATLTAHLRLTDVRWLTPDPEKLSRTDGIGDLWETQPDRCCWLRKTEPLARALESMGLLALITGRTLSAGAPYAIPQKIELDENGVFRINPLASLTKEAQNEEMMKRNIPQHPLGGRPYPYIGCESCTLKAHAVGDPAERWALAAALEEERKGEYVTSLPDAATNWSV